MNIARVALCCALLLPGPAWAATACSGCHGYDLQGMGAPTLKGRSFLTAWGTAEGLYRFFSTAMPASNPGMLSAETYTALLAYLMSANGIPAGSQPPGDTEDARAIDLLQAAGLADTTPQ